MSRFILAPLVAVLCLVTVQAGEPAPAVVEIVLPANANLYVNDALIRSKPGTHRMETPPLQEGKSYTYTFRIEIEREGKTEVFSRKIQVKAGETSKADFTDLGKVAPKEPPKADPPKPDKPAVNEFKMSAMEREIVDRTNAERKKKDLPELKPNPILFAAARKHSENMASQNKLDHNLDGKSHADRIKAEGYAGGFLGENIAAGQRDAAEVVTGWMNSEGHRVNILNDKYTEIGVGIAKTASGTLYFTQVFGKPLR